MGPTLTIQALAMRKVEYIASEATNLQRGASEWG
jgi:hypothetical protein